MITGLSDAEIKSLPVGEKRAMIRSGQIDCPTCKNRKYQDGSNEMVSFKSPAHIPVEASATVVRAHEQEHVSNAYSKAAEAGDAKVIAANVSIHTSICPECGRSYVSSGTTTTRIQYNSDSYAQNSKKIDNTYLPGRNFSADV